MDRKTMEELMGFAPGELEEAARAYESGEWPAGRTVRLGRPPIADEPTKIVSGRVPESIADAFDRKAQQHGQTRAERLRELITIDALSA